MDRTHGPQRAGRIRSPRGVRVPIDAWSRLRRDTPVIVATLLFLVGLGDGARAAVGMWLSEERNPIEVTRESIAGAVTGVEAIAYKFDERSIRSALEAALERGVSVRLLIDADEARAKESQVRQLIREGATVRLWRGDKLHVKLMIVDGREVITGSFNWTESAQHKNVELLVVMTDRADVERAQALFEKLWQQAARAR